MLTMTAKNNMLWWILRTFEIVMQALVFFITLFMLSYHFIKNESDVVTCLLVAVLPVMILYLVRLLLSNHATIMVIHIAAAVFYVFLGKTAEEKLTYILFGAALLIFSMSLNGANRKEDSEKIAIGFGCLFVFASMLGKNAGIDSLTKAGMYSGSIFFILQILYLNFSQVNKYIMLNQQIAGLPIRQIVSVNTFQMIILVILFSSIIFLVSNPYVSRMVEAISTFIEGIVKYILRAIFSIGKDLKSDGFIPGASPVEQGVLELQALMEDSIWTDILNGIGMVIGSLLGMIVVISLCIGVTMILVKKLRGMSFGGEYDIQEFVIPRDMVQFQLHNKKDRMEKGTGTNGKVRKLYKNHVNRAAAKKKITVDATMMPYEITKHYVHNNPKQVTDIYEKARYSNEIITQEEIIVLKQELR